MVLEHYLKLVRFKQSKQNSKLHYLLKESQGVGVIVYW